MPWKASEQTWYPDPPAVHIIVAPVRAWSHVAKELSEERPTEIVKVISPDSDPHRVRAYELKQWSTRHMSNQDWAILYRHRLDIELDSRIR